MTAATRRGRRHAGAALVATLLAAAVLAAPAIAGPGRTEVAEHRTGAVAKECSGVKGKGRKRKRPRRSECHAGRTPAEPRADRVPTDQDGAAASLPDSAADHGAADAGEPPAAEAAEATADPASTTAESTVAVVPSCYGLDWTACEDKVRRAGFTNYQRAIDPYNNCGCGPGGTWRIIDDFGERIEGMTVAKGAHIIIETNPDA